MKELEEKELHHSNENWFLERSRLIYIIDGKNQEIEKMKREMETQRNHIDSIRREVILIYTYIFFPLVFHLLGNG